MSTIEVQVAAALKAMAAHVTEEDLRTLQPGFAPRPAPARRRLAIAGATILVAAVVVVPSVALHRSRGRTTLASRLGTQPSYGPERFLAVDSATKGLGLYDARTGRRLQAVPWPQGGSANALASSGDGERFVGAANTGACSSQLREITVTVKTTGIDTTVGPVIATLPGRTESIAEVADGSAVAATLTCGSASQLAVVNTATGAIRQWPGLVYDNLANGISISPDGRRLAFLASLPSTGMHVLDISNPTATLSSARRVPMAADANGFPVPHLPRIVNNGTVVIGTEGQKTGSDDRATYALAAVAPATGDLKVIAIMPARGWEGLSVDPTGRHALARVGERIFRIDDGRVRQVSKDPNLWPVVW